MALKIFGIIFVFVPIQVLGLGPFAAHQQDGFLETNSLNSLDLLKPVPQELAKLSNNHEQERRLREFLINQCAPHIVREVFKPMSFNELQAKGAGARILLSMPMQIYVSNDSHEPKWCLPVISLEQQILLMKLEYAKQQNQFVWLSKEWSLVFCSLPSIFYLRYASIIFDDFIDTNGCVIL